MFLIGTVVAAEKELIMAKKIFTGILGVFLVVFGAVCVFADYLPEVTEETKVYVKFGGNDQADGLTPDTAKATLGQLNGSGAVSLLKDGGTLVTNGKIVVGGNYVLPELGSALLITADDGTVNYMGAGNNPVGALKMTNGASLTLQSDVIFDKIHLFQEFSTSNVIKVTNNSTLVVGSEVVCSSNTNLSKPVYMTIEVEAGSTVILNGGIFQKVTGGGTIVNNGATIIEGRTAVYVKDGGTGDGSSAETPAGTLTEAMNALDLESDCTIVICGAFTQRGDYVYSKEFSGTVTITSVYGGTDYRTQGAEYISPAQRFVCSGAYIFKDITFRLTGDYFFVIANHNPVTIDTGVEMRAKSQNLTGLSITRGFSVLGGFQYGQSETLSAGMPPMSSAEPVQITVRSGSKIAIGAYARLDLKHPEDVADYTGKSTITVEGTAEVGQLYYAQVNGKSAGNGDVEINMRGDASITRISGSDVPGPMKSLVLNWQSGIIGEFARGAEDTARDGFTLNYSKTVADTEQFAAISAGFDILNTAASAFSAFRTYENQFTDLEENAWYLPYIQTAYEYALANGTSDTKFSPEGKFTVAQALTAAANIHTAYTGNAVSAAVAGEAWYAPYAAYCVQHGIITETQFTDYNRNITRGEMAIVFANILPDDAYAVVRSGSNPDVTAGMDCYDAVQKLYNAGIVGGDSGTGNYRPNDEIVRSEACVIFTRIAVAEYRAK